MTTQSASLHATILQSATDIEAMDDLENAHEDRPICLVVDGAGQIFVMPQNDATLGTPDTFHGVGQLIPVPQHVQMDSIATWIRENVALFEQMCDGLDVMIDPQGNRVGRMSAGGQRAYDELRQSIQEELSEAALSMPTMVLDPAYMFEQQARDLYDEPTAEDAVRVALEWAHDALNNHGEAAHLVLDATLIRQWARETWQEGEAERARGEDEDEN